MYITDIHVIGHVPTSLHKAKKADNKRLVAKQASNRPHKTKKVDSKRSVVDKASKKPMR